MPRVELTRVNLTQPFEATKKRHATFDLLSRRESWKAVIAKRAIALNLAVRCAKVRNAHAENATD